MPDPNESVADSQGQWCRGIVEKNEPRARVRLLTLRQYGENHSRHQACLDADVGIIPQTILVVLRIQGFESKGKPQSRMYPGHVGTAQHPGEPE